MSTTHFSGPVNSTNGFNGAVGGTTPAAVSATTLTTTGAVTMTLPTADPHVAGQLWSNAGAVTVSAG